VAPKPLAIVALISALATGPISAETPLSAIDWLTDTLAEPLVRPPEDVPEPFGTTTGTIEVTALSNATGTSIGLLAPSMTGLPGDLWKNEDLDAVISAISNEPVDLLPSLRRLFITVLLAETVPPKGGDPDDLLLLQRVETLMEFGALDEARALLDRAGVTTPDRFAKWFDLVAISGDMDIACGALMAEPWLSDDAFTRSYCRAHTGDWPAAVLSYEAGRALGLISKYDDALLSAYLDIDPEAVALLPPATDVTPLEYRVHEAVGEPVPTASLPLIFAHADLHPSRGWKARIDAAERLARAGALGGERLASLYTEQKPSASGGAWDRAASFIAVETALSANNTEKLNRLTVPFWNAMAGSRLEAAISESLRDQLHTQGLQVDSGSQAFKVALLTSAYESAATTRIAATPDESFLISIALGNAQFATPRTEKERAIRDGFQDALGSQERLSKGSVGMEILSAIARFDEGVDGDLDGLSGALQTLRRLGLESTARRAALELLLLERRG